VDKIAASKRKGLWVGGTLPLGYHSEGRQDRRYRRRGRNGSGDLRGISNSVASMHSFGTSRDRDIRSKARRLATARTRGGISIRPWLAIFYPAAQSLSLSARSIQKTRSCPRAASHHGRVHYSMRVLTELTDPVDQPDHMRNASDHLLTGLLFDDAGHRMFPTHAD